jgi:hypothetical protein
MAAIEARHIKWDSTQIEDGTLIVELTSPNPKIWKERFANVLALLDTAHSGWGEVHLTKRGIKVEDLQQGNEEQLRHFLESIVMQVNADTGAQENLTVSGTESEPDPDEQMVATFRRFASDHG